MTKLTFLCGLKSKLASLPKSEREERLSFYSEMIDDYMEEGLSEEEAVRSIGSTDAIASDSLGEHMAQASATEAEPKRGRRPWEIALLVLGSPLWIALLAAALAVGVALLVSLWSVVASLWSLVIALPASCVGGALLSVKCVFDGNLSYALALLGCAAISAGLSILAFFGAKYATAGAWSLTKGATRTLLHSIQRKDGAQCK